jgi:hypothetical protein
VISSKLAVNGFVRLIFNYATGIFHGCTEYRNTRYGVQDVQHRIRSLANRNIHIYSRTAWDKFKWIR